MFKKSFFKRNQSLKITLDVQVIINRYLADQSEQFLIVLMDFAAGMIFASLSSKSQLK